MHPTILQMIATDREREIERRAATAYQRRGVPRRRATPPAAEPVSLRLDRVHDHEALLRLAALEGRALPAGPFVVGEVDGSIVAALPLLGGAALADPFHATAEVVHLLALRAAQITRPRRSQLPRRALHWIATRD